MMPTIGVKASISADAIEPAESSRTVGPSAGSKATFGQWGSVAGRGSRPGACRTPVAGAAAPAASGSRPRCRPSDDRARCLRRVRGRWPGRRRAAPRTAPAGPRAAGPNPSRARSPPNQRIEHKFENGSGTLRSPTDPGWSCWGGNSVDPGRQQPSPRPVSRLSAANPHAASRPATAPRLGAFLSRTDAVLRKATEGVVNGCGWHGMQGVRLVGAGSVHHAGRFRWSQPQGTPSLAASSGRRRPATRPTTRPGQPRPRVLG
jgi:hypothetical protein